MANRGDVCDCNVIHQEIVDAVKLQMLPDTALQSLGEFFKTFGDPTRVRILWALDANEMCVCDLAVLLNMTKSAVSHQLRYLKRVDLVRFRREGKVVYYSVADDHVKSILKQGLAHIAEQKVF